MKIIITGITGLIGRAFTGLMKDHYELIGLSRSPSKHQNSFPSGVKLLEWDSETPGEWQDQLSGEYAILNLAGEPIAGTKWTKSQKEKIISSRIKATRAVVEAVKNADNKPKAVLQGSANGYYGQSDNEIFTEQSPPGKGFLAGVTKQWEEASSELKNMDIRVPVLRTGFVLSREGGALPQLLKPFDFYLGGHIGSGKQWISWIHIEDHVRAIRFLLQHETANGPFNLCAPNPVQMKVLTKTAGKIMNKPSWTKAPSVIVETVMGQMAEEMLTNGTKSVPEKLLKGGFSFKYAQIGDALKNLLHS